MLFPPLPKSEFRIYLRSATILLPLDCRVRIDAQTIIVPEHVQAQPSWWWSWTLLPRASVATARLVYVILPYCSTIKRKWCNWGANTRLFFTLHVHWDRSTWVGVDLPSRKEAQTQYSLRRILLQGRNKIAFCYDSTSSNIITELLPVLTFILFRINSVIIFSVLLLSIHWSLWRPTIKR